jgi:hypothetical protein
MDYTINQKINSYPQASTGLSQEQLEKLNGESLKNGISQNGIVKGLGEDAEKTPWLAPVLTLPVWMAMALGMDKFNSACGGEYEKSLIGKVAHWGEKVGNNSLFQSPFMKKAEETFLTSTNFIKNNIISKSKILSAFFHTPSQPKNSMVLTMSKGTVAEIANEAANRLKRYTKDGTINLEKFGLSKPEFEKLIKNPHTTEGIKNLIEFCEKQDPSKTYKITQIGKIPFAKNKYISEFLPITHKLFDYKINFSEYANKLKAFNNTNKTWLGKILPKATLKVVEGITNGTAGGKLAILIAAFFVADALKDAIHAPKEDKIKKFAESNIYNLSFYLTMPLGISLMHRLGGLKYIGMSKEQVEKYREKLTKFNTAVKNREYDLNQYKAEKKILKDMLKGDTKILRTDSAKIKFLKGLKNIIHKPLKFAAKILTTGLENIQAYIPKNSSSLGEFVKNIGSKFKSGIGYPIRFLLFLLVISPALAKAGAKMSHLIFGRPTKSVLDEEEPKAETKEKIQTSLATPKLTTQPIENTNQNLILSSNEPYQKENLIDMYKHTDKSSPVTTTQESVRTYIPSSDGVKIQEEPNAKEQQAAMAINKSFKSEDIAKEFMKG